MVEQKNHSVIIDLNHFKLCFQIAPQTKYTLHFNTPSRRFYLSVIALVVHEMKKKGKIVSIPMANHYQILALLNNTVGKSTGSSEKKQLLYRVYRKWKDVLPNLESAQLFKIVGRKKKYDNLTGSKYGFTENEKDNWANLFEYKGSHEQVRLRFSIDRLGMPLDDVVIVYGASPEIHNELAWSDFINNLKKEAKGKESADKFVIETSDNDLPPVQKNWFRRRRREWLLATLVLLIAGILGVAGFVAEKKMLFAPQVTAAFVDRMALPLPDKPSIAVLPFRNMSDDQDQEYFCTGLTEEIITGLSKIQNLFVIASSSTLTYKNTAVMAHQVSEELGVRYILNGGVRISNERVLIIAKLIDAVRGHIIWAERYDRELTDIFEIQGEITIKILTALRIELNEGELARVVERYTDNLQVYLKILEGNQHIGEWQVYDGIADFEEAIAMDPQCAAAYGYAAWGCLHNLFSPSSTRDDSLNKAFEYAKRCVSLDENISGCRAILGYIYALKRDFERAISEGEMAVELAPNSEMAAFFLGYTLRYTGRHEESLAEFQRAIRLNPKNPILPLVHLGGTLLMLGRYDEAIDASKKALELYPRTLPSYIFLTVAYVSEGRMEDARTAAAKILEIQPDFSMDYYAGLLVYKNKSDRDLLINGLLKAGLK